MATKTLKRMCLCNDLTQIAKYKTQANLIFLILCLISFSLGASPLQDQQEFRRYYQQRFPQLKFEDFAYGIYAIDPVAKESWLAIEEFPPYEPAIEQGKTLFQMPFKNGKHYSDCFAGKNIAIVNEYPQWDRNTGEVVTLAGMLNRCRSANQEKPLLSESNDMAYLLAYLAFSSRGKLIDIKIPKNDTRAFTAYQQGKDFYYQRRGQLNFACATCHVQNVGKRIRSEILSPSLGHTNSWPTYRLKWGEIGVLHRRFSECLEQIKAQPLPYESQEYRNLEYFLSFMGNGIPITGPSTRK